LGNQYEPEILYFFKGALSFQDIKTIGYFDLKKYLKFFTEVKEAEHKLNNK
jgi:hypothetical protein